MSNGLTHRFQRTSGPSVLGAAGVAALLCAVRAPAQTTPQQDLQVAVNLDQVVADTLRLSPGVGIERERVRQAEGVLQSTRGAFDGVAGLSGRSSREERPFVGPTPTQILDESGGALTFSQPFRNGLIFGASAEVFRQKDSMISAPLGTRAALRFDAVVPLLRGLGADVVAAYERAAERDARAASAIARHAIGIRISRSALTYWDCLGAKRRLAVLRESEAAVFEFSRILQQLVEIGELRPLALEQAQAELNRRRSTSLNGEIDLRLKQLQLASLLGREPREGLPDPTGDFPALASPQTNLDNEIEGARHRRGDVQAQRLVTEASRLLERRARDDVRSRLDLSLSAGYSSLSGGDGFGDYFNALARGIEGPNLSATLTLQWPRGRNVARGELVRREATTREAELTARELELSVDAEIASALQTLRQTVEVARMARESEAVQQRVVETIRAEVLSGEATISTLIDNEERLVSAQLVAVDATTEYARALTEYWRTTGRLVEEEAGEFVVPQAALKSIPEGQR
jgi:outer membrane protein